MHSKFTVSQSFIVDLVKSATMFGPLRGVSKYSIWNVSFFFTDGPVNVPVRTASVLPC